MTIASGSLMDHVNDHPWPGCQVEVFGMKVTLMSSGIAQMILVAIAVAGLVLLAARRRSKVPSGGKNLLEAIVVFIRDMVARPALHDKADPFLPFLLTMFVFILGMNLSGLLPLYSLTPVLGVPMGTTPTGILTVCGGLAGISLVTIIGCGLIKTAGVYRVHNNWPMPVCIAMSPILWVWSLSPPIPGITGVIFRPFLALLELVGAVAKCFALVIRMFANMMAGHVLLAVMMMFIVQALGRWMGDWMHGAVNVLPITVCIGASVLIDLMEMMVAVLQAYIFTFLTAIFLGLYVEPAH
jgi:F-type H+-transporting ATPase subunit a